MPFFIPFIPSIILGLGYFVLKYSEDSLILTYGALAEDSPGYFLLTALSPGLEFFAGYHVKNLLLDT